MNGPGLDDKLLDKERPRTDPALADLGNLRTDEDSPSNSGNNSARHLSRSSISANQRRSILKNREGDRRGNSEKRISFNENLKEVHEVENWKQYNVVKKTCCEACWDECTLI